MESVSVTVLKNKLSSFIARVRRGKRVLVLEYGKPVAQLIPVDSSISSKDSVIASLEKEGVISPPEIPPLTLKEITDRMVVPKKGESVDIVKALIAERDERR